MKPRGPRSPISDSCGGFNSRSIRTLGNGADLVLLVTVVHQESIEVPLDDFPGILRTFNDARVMRSFKRNALEPAAGAVATILQGGGRIDRGDYVDQHSSNSLPPLNIGDEYVLFVKFDDQGNAWILGSEEGVFRIRNGRVEPLGDAGAARTWKDRSSSRFFEALGTEVNRQSLAGSR